MAEAGCGIGDISGASPMDFDRPTALQGYNHCSACALTSRARFGDGAVVTPSPTAPIPSRAWLGFGSALRPEVTEDLPQGEGERRGGSP